MSLQYPTLLYVSCIPHFGFSADCTGGLIAYGESEVTSFESPFSIVVHKSEVTGGNSEAHGRALTSSEIHFIESSDAKHVRRDGGNEVTAI